MRLSVAIPAILTLLLAGYSSASPELQPRQAASCTQYSSALSKLRSLDTSSRVSTACSSLLSYSRSTQVVTTTVTRTRTATVATVTRTSTRLRTVSHLPAKVVGGQAAHKAFDFSPEYQTSGRFRQHSTVTQTSNYGGAAKEKRQAATPAPLNSMSVPLSLLSRACSCYVPSPTRATSTRTASTTTVRRVTATVLRTTTRVTTRTIRTTTTELDIIGVYTYVTEYPDSTLTITVTTCRGSNPTPSFGLQIVDSTPTRTDSYNSLYATPTANPEASPDFFVLDYLPSQQGRTFNIDCLGRLYVASPGGGEPLFANVAYFQPGFEVVYFQTQADIEKRDYIYIYCSFSGAFLSCRAPQGGSIGDLTMFQTCPLYDEFFSSPLVIANYQSTDAPECFGLQFRRV